MTVLKMLPKVISAEELFGLITLAKFVHVMEMFGANLPVCWRRELVTAIAADVCGRWVDG
jgi:hypothetical protein